MYANIFSEVNHVTVTVTVVVVVIVVSVLVLVPLLGTLWRMLYLKREDIDPESVIELAQYIRNEQMSLFNISDEAILNGCISFEDPPFWVTEEDKSRGVEMLGAWEEVVTHDGKVYYWNTETGETTWDQPSSEPQQVLQDK